MKIKDLDHSAPLHPRSRHDQGREEGHDQRGRGGYRPFIHNHGPARPSGKGPDAEDRIEGRRGRAAEPADRFMALRR